MKKLILLSALLLTSCDGAFNALDAKINVTAKQAFIKAGGTSIHIIESNAVNPITVLATVQRDALGAPTGIFTFRVGIFCEQEWDMSKIEGYDPFWFGLGTNAPTSWSVTYDAAEDQCAARYCGGAYVGTMNGQTGQVTIGCQAR